MQAARMKPDRPVLCGSSIWADITLLTGAVQTGAVPIVAQALTKSETVNRSGRPGPVGPTRSNG